jgi:putative aldouronate transport system substrate-binding protein
MKKSMVSLISLSLLASIVLPACTDSSKKETDKSAGQSKDVMTPSGTFPITTEKVTLKALVLGHARVEDFNTNAFTKWYEEKTNVHIDWEVAPPDGADQKLNLVLASGDLPDIIFGFVVTPTQQMIYGEQGIFTNMAPLIDKYGPNTKKMLTDMPQVKEAMMAPGGKIYGLPQINACYHCSLNNRAWIYKPWLDKLGLKVPTTTDEFYQALKAFKTMDPNGNGKADEIPFATAPKVSGGGLDGYLMNAYVYTNKFIHEKLVLNNGKIEVAYNKPEWRQGIEYIRQLYKEGLIAPESFTQDANQLKAMSVKNNEIVLGAVAGSGAGVFYPSVFGADKRWADYVALEPLKGPNGLRAAAWNPYPVSAGSWANFIITNVNKHPEISMRWADGLYDEQATIRNVFGIEGEHWKWHGGNTPGKTGMNGKPALWERLQNMNAGVQNFTWQQRGISMRTEEFWGGETADLEKNLDQVLLYRETKRAFEPYKQPLNTIVPPLFFTEQQASELADLTKTINDYVDEMFARFVINDADINKEWENYLKTLEKMNLKKYIEIHQAAYDARKK